MEIDEIFRELCAITKEVFKDVETKLEFAINGETKAVDVAKLVEAGYTVEFNNTISAQTGQKVTSDEDFKYNVVVTKGDERFETGLTDVKVIDGAAAAKINKVTVLQNGKEVNTVVVGADNLVSLRVDEYVNRAGKVIEGNLIGIKLVSKNPEIVVVKGKELMPVQAGKATIEMTLDGMETYTVVLNVAAEARKATTIEGFENLALSIDGNNKGETKTLELTVKDQYGDKMEGAVVVAESSNAGVVKVDGLTVEAVAEGTAKVTLKVADKELASFNVTVKKAGEIATYHLEVQDGKGTTLDLNKDGEDAVQSIDVKFVGRDKDGLLVKEITGPGVEIKSSDTDVATYENRKATAKAVGKAKIVATITEGSLELIKEELEITVINTTKPGITAVKLGGENIEAVENVYTVEYDKTKAVGEASVEFTQPVKVSVRIGGIKITAEQLAEIMAKTGVNLYNYVGKIEALDDNSIASTYEKLGLKGNFDIEVELENESGYKTAFTVKFVEAEQ